jgi:hypothetical protein
VLFDFMEMRGRCPAAKIFFIASVSGRSRNKQLTSQNRLARDFRSKDMSHLPMGRQTPKAISAQNFGLHP